MSDSIAELTAQIQEFVDAREWRKFHNAKDLAVAIAAEAGELMQHFVWQQEEQIEKRLEKTARKSPPRSPTSRSCYLNSPTTSA